MGGISFRLPWVDDPRGVPTFSDHHSESATQGKNKTGWFSSCFQSYGDWGFGDFDPAQPYFKISFLASATSPVRSNSSGYSLLSFPPSGTNVSTPDEMKAPSKDRALEPPQLTMSDPLLPMSLLRFSFI